MPEQQVPPPDPPPPAAPAPNGGNGSLPRRVERLEDAAVEVKERLVRQEARTDMLESRVAGKADIAQTATRADLAVLATKADVAQMVTKAELNAALATLETTMIKWFLVTATALAGLAFSAGRLIH